METNMIQISFPYAAFIVIGIALFQFLAAVWLKARLTESIKHEYAKQLEDYKFQQKIRERADAIAELLARYHYGDGKTPEEFMERAWSLYLWLPPDIARGLTVHLVEAKKSRTLPNELLIKVRKLLLGEVDDLRPEQIVHLQV
jgi:hypothetical protein